MEHKTHIQLNSVSKLFAKKNQTRATDLLDIFLQKNKPATESFFALKNISLEINEGEKVGIIGLNGAGKTTLLNIIAGFLKNDTGKVCVTGQVNPVMSIGTGIKEDLNGVDNIYLNGKLYGKNEQQIRDTIREIIDFADVGNYINKPVRTYSSGMKARLAFSMIAFIEPEILIIDEVLGVGDIDFAAKSFKKLTEICHKGKILLVVSHSIDTLLQLTNRCIWLENGQIKKDGTTSVVAEEYRTHIQQKQDEEIKNSLQHKIAYRNFTDKIDVIQWGMKANNGLKYVFSAYINDMVAVEITMNVYQKNVLLDVIVNIYKKDGILLLSDNYIMPLNPDFSTGKFSINGILNKILFSDGMYEVEIIIYADADIAFKDRQMLKIIKRNEFYLSKPDYLCNYLIDTL